MQGKPQRAKAWLLAGSVFFMFLGGCAGQAPIAKEPNAAGETSQQEITDLLSQPAIDPLTRYLDRHAQVHSSSIDKIRTERDKRCSLIAESYATRDKTAANLEKLDTGYRYSCPAVVQAFSEQVNRSGLTVKPSEATPGTTPTVVSQPPAAPVAKTEDDKTSLEKCYLLFAIKNYRQAREACGSPAATGDARAQYNLGFSARVLQLYPEAVLWTQRSAAQGLPAAQLHLGLLYQRGQGLPLDLPKAAQHYELAGAQGLAEAQYMAGLMYYRGEGVKRNFPQALRWFTQAAAQGHALSQLNVGRMCVQGEGVPTDLAKGHKWLLAAAEQRVPEAQYLLGTMYAQGSGVAADDVQAYVWLSLAHANGHPSAAVSRDKIARKLSPEQLANAQQRSRRTQEGMR